MAGIHLILMDCLPGLNSSRVVSDRGRCQRMFKIATYNYFSSCNSLWIENWSNLWDMLTTFKQASSTRLGLAVFRLYLAFHIAFDMQKYTLKHCIENCKSSIYCVFVCSYLYQGDCFMCSRCLIMRVY